VCAHKGSYCAVQRGARRKVPCNAAQGRAVQCNPVREVGEGVQEVMADRSKQS